MYVIRDNTYVYASLSMSTSHVYLLISYKYCKKFDPLRFQSISIKLKITIKN